MDTTMSNLTSPTVYPAAVVLAVFSGLTVLLDVGPFIWHCKAHNLAAASLVFWIMLLNLANFVNAIIWHNDDIPSWFMGFGLCDIQVKLFVGSWLALTGALICILRNLARIMDTDNTVLVPTDAYKRRQRAIEITLIFGAPAMIMALHYIVQSNRYYIWGIAGCNPSFDNSWVSIILMFIWPLIFALVDAYYAVILAIRLYRYRQQFSRLLEASNTTKSRFLRLFLMATTLVVGFTPLQIYIFYLNVSFPHHAYSWHDVHSNWGVQPVPSGGYALFDRWIRLGCGVLVFLFFGMGGDALKMYRSMLLKLGLGHIFPGLKEQSKSLGRPTYGSSGWTSFNEKAKLMFSKHKSPKTTVTNDSTLSRTSCDSDGADILGKRPKSLLSDGKSVATPSYYVSLNKVVTLRTTNGVSSVHGEEDE